MFDIRISFLNIFLGTVGKLTETLRMRDCALEMDCSSFLFQFCICSGITDLQVGNIDERAGESGMFDGISAFGGPQTVPES